MSNLKIFKSNEPTGTVLCLFKLPSQWNVHVLKKIVFKFNVVLAYALDYLQYGTETLLHQVQLISTKLNVSLIVTDPEFFYLLNPYTIRELNKIRPTGLFLFDPYVDPQSNQLAFDASFVMTGDPAVCISLNTFGVNTIFFPLEGEFDNVSGERTADYDLLFYGSITPSRTEFIDRVKETNDIKFLLNDSAKSPVKYEELCSLIKSAKICINFSRHYFKETDTCGFTIANSSLNSFCYGHKGRIQEVGFANRICVSEYSPSVELLGLQSVVKQFKTPYELLDEVSNLLAQPDKIFAEQCAEYNEIIAKKFSNKAIGLAFHEFYCEYINRNHLFTQVVTSRYTTKSLDPYRMALLTFFKDNPALLRLELHNLEKVLH